MHDLPASLDTLAVLLILLPGFVTLFIERALAYQREPSPTILVARALLYSLLNYAAFTLTGLPLMKWAIQEDANGRAFLLLRSSALSAIVLLAIAAAMGMVVGWLKGHDLHMRLARKLGLTLRTSREGLWLDLFQDHYGTRATDPPFVVVTLRDGRRVNGWPLYFSDEYNAGPVLFLSKAKWLADDASEPTAIPNPGILIKGSEIEFVQFYGEEGEQA